MAILNIVKTGDDILKKRSRPVEKIDERVLTLLDDMKETLAKANGAGLAAVQVGILKRVVIIDAGEGPIELINPEIISTEGSEELYEGCLSFPDVWVVKKRPIKVTGKALDRNGNEIYFENMTGIMAQAFCHETDHLNGKLLVDDIVRYVEKGELE
ncbi:MAG: peptide deformylase [Ruminococcaceae bacterium]|nr:peptide deformylase [Oscillospiraceae bacterium]